MENNIQQKSMENNYIPMTSITSGLGEELLPDVFYFTNQIVNVCFFGNPEETNEWVLIDTGMPKSEDQIIEMAIERFGEEHKPKAIILTHGHFDHVGAVQSLVHEWKIPVYAHELEIPYLTGKTSYPDPDGSVEGGLLAKISPLFPNKPINLGNDVQALPSDGSVPFMPGWRWVHTPGHSPGHVSLFRERDRALIAGDAFINVRQDSLLKVLSQKRELSGPPRYFTTNWQEAKESVMKLEALKPSIAITGHGLPILEEELSEGLTKLINDFEQLAIPDYGRYVN